LEAVKPLFVSRAPQRRNGGSAHKETIYAKPRLDHRLMIEEKAKDGKKVSRRASTEELENMAIEQIGVFETGDKGKKYRLNENRLKDIVGADRNAWMIQAVSLWIAQRGENPKQPGTKFLPRKPRKGDPESGPFTGPEIKSLKLNAGKLSGVHIRNGVAQNDSMIRIDIFRKDGKFHLVPVYVHHRISGLPNRSIAAHKDETQWPEVNEDYSFLFSVYPNDLLRISQKSEVFTGYYAGCDRGSGNVNLWAHDRSINIGKDGLIRGIGVKTCVSVEKFDVDVLGNIYPARAEGRHGLA
jgi:CRISPR-associated endonuclease Csn1